MFSNENNITTTSAKEFLWIVIDLPYNVIVHREVKLIFVSIFFTLKGSLSCHEFHITVKNAVGSFDFRLFDHVQVCLNSLSRLFKRRSNPYRGFTQSVGHGYSLWEGCLNWVNILPLPAFGPFDTVRRNGFSDKRCGQIEDFKFRT